MTSSHSSPETTRPTIENLQKRIRELEAVEKKQNGIIRQLQKEQSLYKMLNDNVFAAIVMVDLQARIRYTNRQLEELSGYSREEITGKNYLTLALPENRAAMLDRFEKLIKGEIERYHIEQQWQKKDGRIIWTEMRVSPVADEEGNIQMVIAAIIDISDKKAMELSLEKTENQYRELVQNANSIILRFDTLGCITFFNEFAQTFFGFTNDEIMGKNIIGMIVPEYESSGRDLKRLMIDIVKHPEIYAANENENIRRNGERVWISWSNHPIVDEQGKVNEILSVGNDITPRKHMEALLRDSEKKRRKNEEYLSKLLDTMKTGVLIIDAKSHRIIDINRHAADLVGLPKEKILHRFCHNFLCPASSGKCPVTDKKLQINGEEKQLLTASGDPVPILKSITEIEHNGRIQLVECFTDIRMLKNLLDEQEIDIHLAKNLLKLINGPLPRHVDMKNEASLFVCAFAASCHKEGGDHYFLQSFHPTWIHKLGRTLISLKDQSGHQVGCILKSIITDLIHQTILHKDTLAGPNEIITRLNTMLTRSGIFREDDFLTAINCEIDHDRKSLSYISCGHPRFLLVRGREVLLLPSPGKRNGANPPLGVFEDYAFYQGEIPVNKGDKIILYTDGLLEALPGHYGIPSHRMPSPEDLQKVIGGIITREPGTGVEEMVSRLSQLIKKSEPDGNCGAGGRFQTKDDVTIVGMEIEDIRNAEELVWHIEDLPALQKYINGFIEEHRQKWTEGGFLSPYRLQICLEEALSNAWKHGSHKKSSRPVIIRHRYGNDFHLDIIDSGKGFDTSCEYDPRLPANRLKESGRGIFLIRKYADHASWKPPGNHLSLVFRKQPAEKASNDILKGHSLNLWKDMSSI